MKRRTCFSFLFLIISSFFSSGFLLGQEELDHEIFLKEMEKNHEELYQNFIGEYDTYLEKNPDDVLVMVEKCKFIQYAQYDPDLDYNPNQHLFDSCTAVLARRFPDHPGVILFQISYLWEDTLETLFLRAEKSMEDNPEIWNAENQGSLYKEMAEYYFSVSDFVKTDTYMRRALLCDPEYEYSLDYLRMLIDMGKKEKARYLLLSRPNTIPGDAWESYRKADILLEVGAYREALEIFRSIIEADSTYNFNLEIASALEEIGEYELARTYLVRDLSQDWDEKNARRRLLRHDLRYQNGSTCLSSYNNYRDLGYMNDPVALYRLKLFFLHPFQPWKFRDLVGLLSLLLLLALLIIVPYMWILPVYFIGHRWPFLARKKGYEPLWGLRAFWLVSAGYLIASLFSFIAEPDMFYPVFNSSYLDYDTEITPRDMGISGFIFIMVMALFTLGAMYKVNLKVLLCEKWSVPKSIWVAVGIFFAYKLVSGLYMLIGTSLFHVNLTEFASIPQIFLSSREEIEALIATVGKVGGFFLICILIPLYEEIICRGVVLDSCQRYMGFRLANLFQSAIFALIHMNLFLFPVYFLFGTITGIMRKKAGGLLPGIIFHAVNNILAYILLIAR